MNFKRFCKDKVYVGGVEGVDTDPLLFRSY